MLSHPTYSQFQGEWGGSISALNSGKLGVLDHHIAADKDNNKAQNKMGASAHLKGASWGMQEILFSQ